MLHVSSPAVTSQPAALTTPADADHANAWGAMSGLAADLRDLIHGRGAFAILTREERAEQLKPFGLVPVPAVVESLSDLSDDELVELVAGGDVWAAMNAKKILADRMFGVPTGDERDELEDRAATLDYEARLARVEEWEQADTATRVSIVFREMRENAQPTPAA